MRAIRKLRSTWRGLETWHGRDAGTLADERARQQGTQTSTQTGAPLLDPTDERGVETGATGELVRHRQTKGAATDMFGLKPPAPHSNSTMERRTHGEHISSASPQSGTQRSRALSGTSALRSMMPLP